MNPSFLYGGALSIPHTSRSSVYSSHATGRPSQPSWPRTYRRRAALLRCAAATPSSASSPLSCGAARDALLSAIRGTERGTRSPADTTAAVLAAIDAMVTACGGGEGASDGGPDAPAPGMEWVDRLAGRWRLLFSTESGLTALMGGGVPLISAADVYQLVEGEGVLKNVVEFSRKGTPPTPPPAAATAAAAAAPSQSRSTPPTPPAGALIVTVEASPAADALPVRRVDFVFRRTGVRWGAGAGVELPFALGRGHFDVLHLDEALRVDKDANGWVNVYAYDGPVERCTVDD